MRRLWMTLPAAILILGCAGPAVHYDYDTRASYKDFHTYDWYAASKAQAVHGAGVQNPLMDARVRRAVEAELAARGLRKETAADPDLLVTYYPLYQRRQGHRARVGLGLGMGLPGMGVGVGVGAPVGQKPTGKIGSIVLEIQDFKAHTVLWRAQADEVLDDTENPEDLDQDVARAVKKMLDRFPPKPRN